VIAEHFNMLERLVKLAFCRTDKTKRHRKTKYINDEH